jgi:hypothetical protein
MTQYISSEGKRRNKEVTQEVRRRSKEKKKQNEKENKRKWHIFVITGRFCCCFTQQILPVTQT